MHAQEGFFSMVGTVLAKMKIFNLPFGGPLRHSIHTADDLPVPLEHRPDSDNKRSSTWRYEDRFGEKLFQC